MVCRRGNLVSSDDCIGKILIYQNLSDYIHSLFKKDFNLIIKESFLVKKKPSRYTVLVDKLNAKP